MSKWMETLTSHFVEGERIYLREVQASDVDGNYQRWMNDTEVTRYLESRFYPHSRKDLQEYVVKVLSDKDIVFMAIILKENDRHIGNIKLGPINRNHHFAEVGIIIGEKDCWGKGYATDAIKLITDYAFDRLNLHRLTAGCYGSNMGSAKAFFKAGWSQEGIRRSCYICEGDYVDAIALGIINPRE